MTYPLLPSPAPPMVMAMTIGYLAIDRWMSAPPRSCIRLLTEEILPRMRLRPGVPDAIATGVRYAVVAGGLLLAIAAAGVDFAQIALLAGALSVGLGFGLRSVHASIKTHSRARAPSVECDAVGHRGEWTSHVSEGVDG